MCVCVNHIQLDFILKHSLHFYTILDTANAVHAGFFFLNFFFLTFSFGYMLIISHCFFSHSHSLSLPPSVCFTALNVLSRCQFFSPVVFRVIGIFLFSSFAKIARFANNVKMYSHQNVERMRMDSHHRQANSIEMKQKSNEGVGYRGEDGEVEYASAFSVREKK